MARTPKTVHTPSSDRPGSRPGSRKAPGSGGGKRDGKRKNNSKQDKKEGKKAKKAKAAVAAAAAEEVPEQGAQEVPAEEAQAASAAQPNAAAQPDAAAQPNAAAQPDAENGKKPSGKAPKKPLTPEMREAEWWGMIATTILRNMEGGDALPALKNLQFIVGGDYTTGADAAAKTHTAKYLELLAADLAEVPEAGHLAVVTGDTKLAFTVTPPSGLLRGTAVMLYAMWMLSPEASMAAYAQSRADAYKEAVDNLDKRIAPFTAAKAALELLRVALAEMLGLPFTSNSQAISTAFKNASEVDREAGLRDMMLSYVGGVKELNNLGDFTELFAERKQAEKDRETSTNKAFEALGVEMEPRQPRRLTGRNLHVSLHRHASKYFVKGNDLYDKNATAVEKKRRSSKGQPSTDPTEILDDDDLMAMLQGPVAEV
jgi:hypothetical protein